MGVYIIAEAGVNHNGSLELAYKMIDVAKSAGADCIKFQTFKTEKLVSLQTKKASYQKATTGDGAQKNMLKKLELSYDDFNKLKGYCDKSGISFLSSPFDLDSIAYLNTMNMPFWKIPSGEITDYPYLVSIANTGRPVVMSTGMCELSEIRDAVNVLKEHGTKRITLLQCNTEYPTPYQDVNLKVMDTLKREFKLETGYSDHTKGIEIPIAAAALGAAVIEKHFTLDRTMEGPDQRASIEPDELEVMIKSIRNVEEALGTGKKRVSESERKNIAVARKSIVASKDIKKDDILTDENITAKRPGDGLSPMLWDSVIGTKAIRDFREDELIEV